MKRFSLLLVLFLLLALSGCNNVIQDSKEPADSEYSNITKEFIDENNIDATIIVYSMKTGKEFIINKERSKKAFLPASTFKIPNTLIALQEGVIKDENEIIKWDGTDKGYPSWNKDQNLKTALPSSCVWFYQELAKEIGTEKYTEYFNKMNYGNKELGASVDNFWLEGDLRISAEEQIEFIKKVYNEEYDFNENYYKILKDLMIDEKNDKYTLRAKTGWTMRVTPQTGWYVGYVETSEDTWLFACNLEIRKESDADYRKELTLMYLRDLKIIE